MTKSTQPVNPVSLAKQVFETLSPGQIDILMAELVRLDELKRGKSPSLYLDPRGS
jgi:hypothetical protein